MKTTATTPRTPDLTADITQPGDERKPAALPTRNNGDENEQSILRSIVDAPTATPMDLVGDDDPIELSEDENMSDGIDGADDDSTSFGGSVESLGTNVSSASVSTMGQSVVTWAQVASHHTFDPSLGAADTAIQSDSEEVEMSFPTRSNLTKLESKRSKDRKAAATQEMSSLQAAYNQGSIHQLESAEKRAPIRPPQRDAQGRLLFTDEEETGEAHGADSDLVVYDVAPKSRYAVRILRKKMLKMKEDNEILTAMVQKLNLAVAQLLTNQPQMVAAPALQPQELSIEQHGRTFPDEVIEQVSTDIVEWSPSRHRRRSKKTVLQSTERSPPREPAGTPQVTKKKRVSESPIANRFGALASDTSDAEMDETIEFGEFDDSDEDALANEVGARVNNLRVHNTFLGPDPSTEIGAGLHK